MAERATAGGHVTWHLLGGMAVEVDGAPVALGPRLRFALGCLLEEPGRAVAAEVLAGDTTANPGQAATAGRVAIRRLRVALDDAGICGSVSTTAAGYALDVDPLLVDHVAFTRWCRAADTERWPDAAWRYADRARRAWRGRPFGDLSDEPRFQASAAVLEEQHRQLVERWGELVLQTGTHERSISVLADDVAADPLRERRWATLALARYRSGNQVAALRTVAEARRELIESVGVEPGRELQALEQQLLAQDPELDWRPAPAVPSGLATGPVVVGRGAEVHDVIDLLDRHRIVVLEGPSGMGKTTVAAEVCQHVARSTVWVPLATVDASGTVRAIAAALELPDRAAGYDDIDALARHLHRAAALLVLDGFGDSGPMRVDTVAALVSRAPDLRVLVTSRAPLPIPHGIQRQLAPLAAGEPDDPGPAALLAADFSSIPRRDIAARWATIEGICRQSGGVPLALCLLAHAAATGELPAADGPGVDLVGDAARAALGRLSPRAVDLVTTLAELPVPVTVPLAARVLTATETELRASLGAASRAGLVTQSTAGDTLRVRVSDPVVAALRPHGPDPATTRWLATRIAEVTIDLIDAAQPSLVGRPDLAGFAAVDDDHEAVQWALQHLPDQPRLRLANRLAVVWSTCGRNLDGAATLAGLELLADAAPPIERVRYWVMRAQISPALSARAAVAPHLEGAVAIADRLGHDDLAVRCMTELALGRIWGADAPGAIELLDACERRVALDVFGRLTLATLRAMVTALAGNVGDACDDLVRTADAFDDAGMACDAVGVLHIALTLASLGGDEARSGRILELAAAYVPDRFTGYAAAAMRYRQAQRLMAHDDQRAGPMLFDAYGTLHRHGDGQWAASCLADLGWWRANHDDPGGLVDLANAALDLLEVWSSGAALALARIAVLSSRLGRADDARLLAAAAVHQPESGISPSAADLEFVERSCRDLADGEGPPADAAVRDHLRALSLA